MVLWNLVLSGYPGSGKTTLAERLVSENSRFARLCGDDLRRMLFNEHYPCRDEKPVFLALTSLRDLLLRTGWSVVIDTTAPDNIIRTVLLSTKTQDTRSLLIVMDVKRSVLMKRNRKKGRPNAVHVWDRYWIDPLSAFQTIKFKANSRKEFKASYRALQRILERSTEKTCRKQVEPKTCRRRREGS